MKNKVLIIISIVLLAFFLRVNFMKDRVENIEYVYEQRELIDYSVFYYNENELVHVVISVDDEEYIPMLFNLLTNQSNTIKEDYETKLIVSTKLISYEIEEDNLMINLTEDFLRYKEGDGFKIINQLKNTFSNLGYENLLIKVEGVMLESIDEISIYNGLSLYNI